MRESSGNHFDSRIVDVLFESKEGIERIYFIYREIQGEYFMTFIVNGYDYTDEGALARRLEARELHMAGINRMYESKEVLYAAAMLNKNEEMCGSVLIVDFESRDALDNWLKEEAYVINKVWDKIEVIPCKVPPLFL